MGSLYRRPGPASRIATIAPLPADRRPAFAGLAAAIAAAVALLLAPAGVEGARVYDPYQLPRARYVPPLAPWPETSYRAKDFTVHRKGAYYHLFYTRVQRHVPEHWGSGAATRLNERTFGHAISSDLELWFEADTVLTVSQDSTRWDAHHLWAPSLHEQGDTTWMVFTGVRDRYDGGSPANWVPRWQVIGAAYSTDPLLMTWTPLPSPVWSPCANAGAGLPGVSWALCNPTQPGRAADFRDPFVLPPAPGSGDPWLLYYTARPRTDQYNYVAGVAQGPGPIGPWSDLGALWDTYYPPLNSKVESPHVFRRGADWHLMFTGDDGTTGIAWHTSAASPVGPWTTRPSLNQFLKDAPDHPHEFVLEPEAWFASEHFSEPTPSGTAEYLAVVHSYDAPSEYNAPAPATPEDISLIEFRRMVWDAGGFGFGLYGPNPVRTLAVDDATVNPGQTVELRFLCEGGKGRRGDLGVTVTTGGGTFDVDPGEVGLPGSVLLDDPQSSVAWTVATAGYAPPLRVTVSMASQPLRTGVSVDVSGGGDPVAVEPIVRGGGARLRLVARGTGAGTALEFTLPGAGPARLALYDAAGRRVRTLFDEALPAGAVRRAWDGRGDDGRAVPPGLYFARLTTAFGARTARLIALR